MDVVKKTFHLFRWLLRVRDCRLRRPVHVKHLLRLRESLGVVVDFIDVKYENVLLQS